MAITRDELQIRRYDPSARAHTRGVHGREGKEGTRGRDKECEKDPKQIVGIDEWDEEENERERGIERTKQCACLTTSFDEISKWL